MSQVSLADLQNENDAERSFRKFKLVCEEVQVRNKFSIWITYPLDDDSFVLFGDSCDPTDWFARQADTSSAHLNEIVKIFTILISIYPTGQELPD